MNKDNPLQHPYILEDKDKVEILLHYDTIFREDWRFILKSRTIVSGAYLGLQTTMIGWILSTKMEFSCKTRIMLIVISFVITLIGVFSMFFYSRSINRVKRNIVKIEIALMMFKENVYNANSILNTEDLNWGIKRITKTTIGAFVIGIIFPIIIMILLNIK